MVKTAAKNASRTVVWVILLLIIVGLGGFGAVSFSGNLRSVGTVGETPIPISRYQRQLSQDMRALQSQTGMEFGMAQAQAFGLDRAALGKVVAQVAVENAAHEAGLSVGDAEVQKRLFAMPAFQGFDGKFDSANYRDTLKRNGLTVSGFETEIRAEAARSILNQAIGTGVVMPEAQVEAVYQWAGQRRSFVWAELTEADLAEPIPEPTEADLKGWYEAHPDPYTTPEARRITYAWITPSMMVDKIEIDEDALRKLYDDRAAQYHQPERRLVERLVFGSEDEAKAAWDRLQAGEVDFDALVAERGLALADVDMGDMSKEDLGTAGDAVFGLAEPGVVGPVATDLGPAILRVNAILPAEDTAYEDVREELKDDYATDRARRLIEAMQEQVNDELAGGATLEELAKDTDLELGQIDYSEATSDGIAGYAAFRQAAAAAKADDFPEAVQLDDGGLFALRLDQIVEPQLRPYEQVKTQVAQDWTRDTTRVALEKLADELIPRLESGEAPGSFGLTVNSEEALTRDAYLADVPEGLVAKAFELDKGKAARIDGTPGTAAVAIVQTTDILAPDPDNADMTQARGDYAGQLNDQLAADLQAAFTQAVEAAAQVRIDQSAVNAVNAQFQ